MAVTADQVVVELKADVNQYMQNVARAQSDFSQKIGQMGQDAVKAGNASAVAFNAATGAFQKVSPAIKKTGDESKLAQQQMRNLAFQFQDVGTMLAAGQSPFMLLAQQLPQITMYGGQLTGVMGALKSTVSGLISPLGLATTAFVLLGSTAISYFDELFASGEKSEEQLKKEAQLIQGVVDKWGEALPALKAYNDERQRTESNQQVEDATAIAVEEQWSKLKDQIGEFTVSYADLMAQLQSSGAPIEDIEAFRQAFFDLKGNIEEGKATQQDYEAVTAALSNLLTSTSIPAVAEFAATIASLIGPLNAAARATAELNRQANMQTGKAPFEDYANNLIKGFGELEAKNQKFTEEAQKRNSLSSDQLDLENEIARVRADANKAGAVFSDAELKNLAQQSIEADKRRSAEEKAARASARGSGGTARRKSAGSPKTDAFERTSQSYSDRTATIVAETEAMRGLDATVDDYGYTLAKARAEQSLINAAQKEGKEITPLLRDNISQIAEQYARATAEAALLSEQQSELKRRSDEWQTAQKDALRGVVDDLIAGKSAAEAFAGALQKIADKLLDMAFDDLFTGLFKGAGGGGGFFSSLLGGLFRESGGPVKKGQPYIVGEKRPEVFVPDQNGTILPRVPSAGAPTTPVSASAGKSSTVVQSTAQISINLDGANSDTEIRKIVASGVREGLTAYDKQMTQTFGSRIVASQRDQL
ncbi:phage tail length tape measure family protein [Brucella pseudogrignonensis]|uniref:phage tail length tape measure family protein n=1 Tax=Brucella pseudogrignonensis TaxID=419475 RepID=UPI003ECE59DA